jgi:hypothetical protein
MTRHFVACRQKVFNRGTPPEAFLNELVDWGRAAPSEIFEHHERTDIYAHVAPILGPYGDLTYRKAVMLEVLRVLGGFESSWNWSAGVDTTNPNSNKPCTEEAGMFQCSGNSMNFSPTLKGLLVATGASGTCDSFRETTKQNHQFSIEYCARLLRFTTNHHGPIKQGHIDAWLRREAVAEFQSFLI